jgi:large subunit ribosomal protein L3
MKGIVGRKLGMTRVFDAETGVVTPVTVIEAEPCPVVQVKTTDAHGYDAVQIAYDKVADRKLTKAEAGHLKKNNVDGAYRHLLELRGQSELVVHEIDTERNLLLVKGAVPGPKNGFVEVREEA